MDKNVKNVLAAVGAVAVVKAVPVLALGAAIGAAAANPEKVKEVVEKTRDHVGMVFAKYGMDVSGESETEVFQEETETFEEEPEVNVAPAVEIYNETATSDEEEVNPNEAGNWGVT